MRRVRASYPPLGGEAMKSEGAKKQTAFLTGVNAAVRAMGLLMRVMLSRLLGPEIMGITELAQSVHMLAITPLTSGLPLAISRMTAKAGLSNKRKPLLAGLMLVRSASVVLIPALLLLSPLLARMTCDVRVLPSLWFTAPCVLILGYSAAFNGYCYGMELSRVPALSELIEQALRVTLALLLIFALRHLTAPWLAAVPVAATMLAELAGLWYVLRRVGFSAFDAENARAWRKPVLRLALPTTFTRVIQTLMRSVTAILIPLRLQASGLPASEATARLGMLNGMVMPFLMLPCVFTSALSMVSMPRIAKAEDNRRELRRLLLLCAAACVPVGVLSAMAIYLLAPLLSNSIYRLAELGDLFRSSAPMAALFSVGHLSGGIIAALGEQKRSMYGTLAVSMLTLVLTYFLAGDARWRLNGVIAAQAVGQAGMIAWNACVFLRWRRHRR